MTNNDNQEGNLDQAVSAMADVLMNRILGALTPEELAEAEKNGLQDIQDTFAMALAETDREALRDLSVELTTKLEGYRLIRKTINTEKKTEPETKANPLADLLTGLFGLDPKDFKF